MEAEMLRCSRCDVLKPASEYYINPSNMKPRRICMRCYKIRQLERYRQPGYKRPDRQPIPWESPPAIAELVKVNSLWSR